MCTIVSIVIINWQVTAWHFSGNEHDDKLHSTINIPNPLGHSMCRGHWKMHKDQLAFPNKYQIIVRVHARCRAADSN